MRRTKGTRLTQGGACAPWPGEACARNAMLTKKAIVLMYRGPNPRQAACFGKCFNRYQDSPLVLAKSHGVTYPSFGWRTELAGERSRQTVLRTPPRFERRQADGVRPS